MPERDKVGDKKQIEVPDRGDFVYLNFDSKAGREQAGRRPAIVLSPKKFNLVTGYASVCPISTTEREWGFHIPIPDGLAVKGVIIGDQVKNLDWKKRKAQIVGQAPAVLVNETIEIVHTYLYVEEDDEQ